MPTIAEVMTPAVPHLSVDCTIGDALDAFDASNLEALPLCDPDGMFLGVVSRQDVSRAFRSLGELTNSLRAQHLMKPDAPSIGVHDSMEKAMAQMAIHQTRFLPVLDGVRVCGMLTSTQIGQARPRVDISELVKYVQLPVEPGQGPPS